MLDPDQSIDYTRRYDGVSPGILSDGTWLLDRPGFWAGLLDGFADTGLVDTMVERGDPGELHQEIVESGRWPVLRLGAGESDIAVVHWHGPDNEGGLDFVILPHGTGRCLSVASVEGHGWGPGLCWPEAARLVGHGTLGTAAQRLLLLHPAIGDADAPPEAVALLTGALRDVCGPGVDADTAAETAAQLFDHDARWSMRDGALICDDDHAPRHPGRLPHEDLLLITRALAAR